VHHTRAAHGKAWGRHMPARHCRRRAPTCSRQVGPSLPCAIPKRRTAKADGPSFQSAIVGVEHRLCRAPDMRGARQRFGPTCQSGTVGVDPRPVAGRWAGLCRAPAPCGARQRLGWAPWIAGGPVFTVCQTPAAHDTACGAGWVCSLSCAGTEAHGNDRDRG
jgi:hypothetical protein